MGKLIGPGAVLLLYVAIIAYSFMKRRNNGSDKPQEHPCEYCLRWEECNGVDAEICPLIKNGEAADEDRETYVLPQADGLAQDQDVRK